MKFRILFALAVVLLLTVLFGGATINPFTPSAPANESWTNNNQPDFSFTAVSNINTTFSCVLWVSEANLGSNSSTQNNTLTTITASTIADGTHNWYINCTDVNGTVQSTARTLNVDTTNSTVASLNEPSNGANVDDTTVEFNFTSYDNLDENWSMDGEPRAWYNTIKC